MSIAIRVRSYVATADQVTGQRGCFWLTSSQREPITLAMRGKSWIGVAALCCCFAAEGGIIYDNTGPWLGGYGFTALEQGDEVHAVGSERLVTRLTVGVGRQNVPGVGDFQAQLYANDGTNGQPGTLLWQSALMLNVQLSGGVQLISFDVPQVAVPDTFTWTLESYSAGVAVGLVNADPPSIGTSPSYDWFGHPGSWTQLHYTDWMARVEAVPEPSSFILLLVGLALLGNSGRRVAANLK